MSRCMLLFPNRADKPRGPMPGASITGPAWALPLENLQDRESFRVARSVDTDPANTQFDVRLNGNVSYRALVLCGHNLSVTSSFRVTGWFDDQSYGAPEWQVSRDAFAAQAYTEDLEWEAENWWDGRALSEEVEGFTQNAILIMPAIRVAVATDRNQTRVAVNGVSTSIAHTSGRQLTLSALTTLTIGKGIANGSPWSGQIKRIASIPRFLALTDLENMTRLAA